MISARIREAVAKRYWLRKPLVAFFTCAMPICCSIVSAEEPYQIDWIRQFGATSRDIGRGISGDALGNVYLTGFSAGEPFIAQYSPDGSELWYNGIDDANLTHGIWTDNLGISYITGSTRVDLGGGPVEGNRDVAVIKYDPRGEAIWIRQFGDVGRAARHGISGDGLGNLYIIAGLGGDESIAKYGVDGTHQWTEQLPFDVTESEGIAADGLGNVFITGHRVREFGDFGVPIDVDIFVAKYDADGRHLWSQQIGTDGIDIGNAIWADSLGNVYVTGEMQRDAFVAKLIPADVAFLPGDINGDGTVNLSDFSTLKANFGSDNATRAMGDLDGDMLVDINDFNILKANFGNTATVTAISCAGLQGTGYRTL